MYIIVFNLFVLSKIYKSAKLMYKFCQKKPKEIHFLIGVTNLDRRDTFHLRVGGKMVSKLGVKFKLSPSTLNVFARKLSYGARLTS